MVWLWITRRIEVQVDQFVTLATQGVGHQLRAVFEGGDGVLEQGVFAGFARGRGDGEVHATHFQIFQQFASQFGESGKVRALEAQFGAFAPAGDFLAFVIIDRVAVAAALTNRDVLDLTRLAEGLVHGFGDVCSQFGRIRVLRFAVQRDHHQVALDFLADFGTYGNLIVMNLFSQRRQTGKRCGAKGEEGGSGAKAEHKNSLLTNRLRRVTVTRKTIRL